MSRSIVLSALLLFAAPALAQDATGPNPCADLATATKNLGPTATETLLESCRTKSGIPSAVEKMADPDTASKWAEAAKGFAQALGIAAKELGVATNDFLDSPAGYLLAAILLFNFAGGAIIGFPFTIFSMYFWWMVIKRIHMEKIEYERVPVLWGAFTLRRVKTITQDPSDYAGIWSIMSALGLLIMNAIVWLNVT